MFTHVSHVFVPVLDQEEALAFYVGKLGFSIKTDAALGEGYRWVTVVAPEQPEVEIMMSQVGPPAMDPDAVRSFEGLLAKGALWVGVLETRDCRATWRELTAKGVEFTQEPVDRFYGVDAAFRDPFGNGWRVTERKQPA